MYNYYFPGIKGFRYLYALHDIIKRELMQVFRSSGKRTVSSVLNEMIKRVNSDARRLRLIEQDTSIHKTRIGILEKEFLEQKRNYLKVIKGLENRIEKQEDTLIKMENYIKEIVKQLKRSATKADLGGLEELVDLFNPLTSKFVTKKEVNKLILASHNKRKKQDLV